LLAARDGGRRAERFSRTANCWSAGTSGLSWPTRRGWGHQRGASTLKTIDCSKPHGSEVFAVFKWAGSETDDQYPGDSPVQDKAVSGCQDGFQPYVGSSVDTTSLSGTALKPTVDSWKKGDRTFICLAYTSDGSQLTGSVKGSNK
jgi:hypothetical protein